ncbi:phosphatidylinositol-specific phospholipase C/glycerophosphodiester phosphodiesterase family protein [Stieleria sp. JC731]|uniref:phosphatidylinositol-specific phospholipase C/glycerophosphodiester phosphodiesterase family protein n=1 Tax=Pirellulaceae TaxID=2691357 RepID=UPI001E51617A|nr:phosphatidylinositol-specific phospholipase C/glycerophosphodiester phosphodiesterase family protein [Stieleria sp. JC731]MCC9599458.1 phosphatidylinositol-specific phospholipase C/glycerophosphodiester phosphodiesterase family protein [Stieleria sp. JC731]
MLQKHRLVFIAYLVFVTCNFASSNVCEAVEPLRQAHAHNDYWHDRPLHDALDNGFCSVESDIFLWNGALLVGHDPIELKPDRTLQHLYLDPLKERIEKNGGKVFKDGPQFTLMVDVKTEAESTYEKLEEVLKDYRELLCRIESGKYVEGPIQVIVSGNRTIETMRKANDRLSFVDGRLEHFEETTFASTLMPLISERWSKCFRWNGEGEFPTQEKMRLQALVNAAHANGQRVRFWATSENEAVWKALLEAGVDHINTDELKRLAEFLKTSS